MCQAMPKFGNDIDEVDHMVQDLGSLSGRIAETDKYQGGVRWMIYRNGMAWHYTGEKAVGALPNGRKAGEPLNDGSISPMRGRTKQVSQLFCCQCLRLNLGKCNHRS